jgi:hypothetical protein
MTMHEPHIETGATGAFRQSWRDPALRSMIVVITAEEPSYDEAAIKAECWNRISAGWEFVGAAGSDWRLMYSVFSYWFDNNYLSFIRWQSRRPVQAQAQAQEVQAAETVQEAQEAQEAAQDEQEAQDEHIEPEQPQEAPEAATAQREARRSALRAAIEERINTICLDLMMPNGKPLRDNTREDFDDAIEWQKRIRDRLQPGQTPDEAGLTEEDVRDLL